jgi:hypothetical protein
MPLGAFFDFRVKAIVAITSIPVVAATDLWMYSITKSS